MMPLHELQRRFAKGLRADNDDGLRGWIVGEQAAERFDIYRRNRAAALKGALELSFPAVRALVGPDFFSLAAESYARTYFPRTALLSAYGEEFPTFLRDFPPASGLPYLPDVARVEWTAALCTATAEPRGVYALAGLVLTLAPGLTLLHVDYRAGDIWRAVLDLDEPGLAQIDPGPAPTILAVWREGAGASVAEVSLTGAAFIEVLTETGSVETALARTTALTPDPVALITNDVLRAGFAKLTPIEGTPS